MKKKIVVGISGASGVIYGIRLLEVLKQMEEMESHLILSANAAENIAIETNYSVEEVAELADRSHDPMNLAAPVSSGSFLTEGMVVIPCSMKSLSGIVHSYNDNLLIRAADVTLKERRKLIVSPRETPLHKGHLKLMSKLVDNGGVALPPVPAFYHRPKSIEDIIDHTAGKILDLFGLDHRLYRRWV